MPFHFTSEQLKQALLAVTDRIEREKEYLSELDRAVGDGDHGVTMSIGWRAVAAKLQETQQQDCGAICQQTAMAFLNAVGSSVGPLYSTAFLRAGAAVQGKSSLSANDSLAFWSAFAQGIQERGKAQIGDKTMVDTWGPAVDRLKQACANHGDFVSGFAEAVAAGEAGMRSTVDMLSRAGRSSRLGNRSIGHQDPGATSAYYILETFLDAYKRI